MTKLFRAALVTGLLIFAVAADAANYRNQYLPLLKKKQRLSCQIQDKDIHPEDLKKAQADLEKTEMKLIKLKNKMSTEKNISVMIKFNEESSRIAKKGCK